MEQSERHFDLLQGIIDRAFKKFYKGEPMESEFHNKDSVSLDGSSKVGDIYESIEDYTQRTGKRFRMTKEQKQRGLSRDEAFTETHGELNG
jgi:hypothetical protein